MEKIGSSSGKPKKSVIIVDCGELTNEQKKKEKKLYYRLNETLPDIENIEQFIDKEFPPNDESLFSMKDKLKQDKEAQEQLSEFKNNVNPHGEESVYWKRIFFENKNFEEDIDSSNIVQGRIGDCYFISYLYNLSKYAPEIFGSLFRKQDRDKGYFEINFFLE